MTHTESKFNISSRSVRNCVAARRIACGGRRSSRRPSQHLDTGGDRPSWEIGALPAHQTQQPVRATVDNPCHTRIALCETLLREVCKTHSEDDSRPGTRRVCPAALPAGPIRAPRNCLTRERFQGLDIARTRSSLFRPAVLSIQIATKYEDRWFLESRLRPA